MFSFRWVEDESWYSSTAYTLLHEGQIRNGIFGPTEIESKADTRPIAMPVTLASTFALLGVGPAQARIPEFVAALGAIVLAFWLGKLLHSSRIGLLAAVLMCADNMVFLAARTVRPEAFVMLFGTLATLLYLLSRRKDSVGLAALAGLALGISFNYHVNGFAMAAGLGLLLIGEHGWSVWRSKRAWAMTLSSILTLIPFCVWLAGDPIRQAAFQKLYGRGNAVSWADLLHTEAIRYADLLGIGSQRLHFFPVPIPLRLHIVLLIVVSLGVLAWKRRTIFWMLLALIVPSLLVWTKEVNPSARFFAILAPYFAVAIALAFVSIDSRRWRTIFGCWCALVVVTEVGGNLLLLRQSRPADYADCGRQIQAAMPPNARVFGAITFFMAMHDHAYYAWNRTPLDIAVDKLGVDYLILNDRVLVRGSGFGHDDWKDVRETAERFVRANADLVATVPAPFYGDLQIYHVRPGATAAIATPPNGRRD